MITLDMSESEYHAIRAALRFQEDAHKRNGFDALVLQMQEIRSKLNDSYLDRNVLVG